MLLYIYGDLTVELVSSLRCTLSVTVKYVYYEGILMIFQVIGMRS